MIKRHEGCLSCAEVMTYDKPYLQCLRICGIEYCAEVTIGQLKVRHREIRIVSWS